MTEQEQKEPRKGGGCFRFLAFGCLGVLVLLGLAALALSGFFSHSNAKDMYSGAPDPVATARLNQQLSQAGINGASAVVIPIKGQTGQIAILTFDESQGFSGLGQSGAQGLLQGLTQANQEGNFDISRVAIDYRGPDGENLATVTADEASVEAYAAGQISQDQFLANTDVDFSSLLEAFNSYQDAQGGQ